MKTKPSRTVLGLLCPGDWSWYFTMPIVMNDTEPTDDGSVQRAVRAELRLSEIWLEVRETVENELELKPWR